MSPILEAILGGGQGLMKPNLGGIRYRRAEGSLVLQAGLAWSSRWRAIGRQPTGSTACQLVLSLGLDSPIQKDMAPGQILLGGM